MFLMFRVRCPEQQKGAITVLRNTCLLWFHSAVCEKHETEKTAPANATSLFIILPGSNDPVNSNKRCTSQSVYMIKISAG